MPQRHKPEPPPQRPIDEGVLLGYLLLRAPHPDAIEAIQPALFQNLGHRLTLAAITTLRNTGTEPCPIAVCAALERAGDLETAGGRGYLCGLIDGVVGGPTGWKMLEPYLESVATVAKKRKLANLATDLAYAATNGHALDEIATLAVNLADIASAKVNQDGLPWIDLTATPEPGSWLVRSIIPQQGRLLLVAPSGAGKSWILEDIAISVAIGSPWLGLEEFCILGNRGPVLIIDEESAASRIRYRLARLAAARSLTLSDLAPTSTGGPGIQVSCLAGVNLGDPVAWGLLRSDVRRLKPSLVILDAAIRFIQGNENESQYVGPFWSAIGALQVMGTAVAIAHHTGWLEKDRARGSTDWHGGADCVLTLSKTESSDRQKLTWTKMKDPPDFKDPDPIYIDRTGHAEVSLSYGGLASEDAPSGQSLDAAILEAVALVPLDRSALLSRFPTLSPSTVDRAIKRLKESKRLNFTPSGYRCHA